MANDPSQQYKSTQVFTQEYLPEIKPDPLNILSAPGGSVLDNGQFRSPNFRKSRAGWFLDSDGASEFGDGVFRGTFSIGGTTTTIDSVSDLQTTLNTISAAGGGTVYLNVGTYTLTSDISIPSGVVLQGVSRDGVIIDCNLSYKVTLSGTNGYTTGTVTINDTDTTVVGSGTTWTSAMIGRSIFLGGNWYEITAFTDTTHITIGSAYSGSNLSGSGYAIATLNSNPTLRRVTIQNATGSAVVSTYSQEINLTDVNILSSGTGIDLDYCYAPNIFVTSFGNGVNLDMNYVSAFKVDFCAFDDSTTGAGVVMSNCLSATFFDSSVSNNTGDGFNMTNCTDITFISVDASRNGGQGIEMVSGNTDLQFIAVTSSGNTSDGYKLTATSDRITISSCSIHDNGGYGINVAASSCDNNYIIAPAFSGNTSGTINDSGTGTVTITGNTTDIAIPQPVAPSYGTTSINPTSNVQLLIGAFYINTGMRVSKVTLHATAVTSPGAYKVAMFSVDGQTQLFSFDTGTISSGGLKTFTLGTPVFIASGIYYFGILPNGTPNVSFTFYDSNGTMDVFLDVTSEPRPTGYLSVTASTMPSTINPASILSGVVNDVIAFRLDN